MVVLSKGKGVPARFVVDHFCTNCGSHLSVDIEADCVNSQRKTPSRTIGGYDLMMTTGEWFTYKCPVCGDSNHIFRDTIVRQDYKKYDEPDDDEFY